MKKLIGVVLVLMLAVTGLAFAENAGAAVKTADGYLLVCFKNGDQETLALIGSGSGEDVMNAFVPGEDDSQRFEALWSFLTKFQPSMVLEGSVANLRFEPDASKNTQLTLNGVIVAQLEGQQTFAVLSGDELPSVRPNCKVQLWTRNNGAGEICVNCGGINDGSGRHGREISQFCDENHTECMGDPVHHCEVCGKDYACSKSGSHTECAVCGKLWCDKSEGDHTAAECGHRGCEVYGNEAAHALCMICGGYSCDGEDHAAAECGLHHAADEGSHAVCENCGGFLCDGEDHSHKDEIPEGDVTVEGDAPSGEN